MNNIAITPKPKRFAHHAFLNSRNFLPPLLLQIYHTSFAPLLDFGPHQQVTSTKGAMSIPPKTPIHDYIYD
jgi:hypothetical protein